MLAEITEGVLVQQSGFMQSNTVAVTGAHGVLLVDVGITGDEIAEVAAGLGEQELAVVAGFSTHPHWDHLLWHADFGAVPRYGTAQAAVAISARLASPGWEGMVAGMIPADIVDDVPLNELFGRITGLPEGATTVSWEGPETRLITHSAHAAGHAALIVTRVLIAGDMLSDVLVPILNAMAPDPVGDYLAALDLLEAVVDDVDVVIPGHGSVGTDLRERIGLDRAYVLALRDGDEPDDPRLRAPKPGWEWVSGLHTSQAERLQKA